MSAFTFWCWTVRTTWRSQIRDKTKLRGTENNICMSLWCCLQLFLQQNANADGSPDGIWTPWRILLRRLRFPARCSRSAASQRAFCSGGSHVLQKQIRDTKLQTCDIKGEERRESHVCFDLLLLPVSYRWWDTPGWEWTGCWGLAGWTWATEMTLQTAGSPTST